MKIKQLTYFIGKEELEQSKLVPLNVRAVESISKWEYERPYHVYNFKGTPNGYLSNKDTWGVEQFCLIYNEYIVAQVACQIEGGEMWVGWSLNPNNCGKGQGSYFVAKCISELYRVKEYRGNMFLSVVAWNKRAIASYEKAGFVYKETIQDEIAYSGKQEDFFIMKYTLVNA